MKASIILIPTLLLIVIFIFMGCAINLSSSTTESPEKVVNPERTINIDPAEKVIIVQRALDYIEGWYTADTDRLRRTLSPHLVKRQITEEGKIRNANKSKMLRVAKEGYGLRSEPEKARKEITVLDQSLNMASVRVVSEEFVDYLHLVKSNGEWTIVNVLWNYHR